MTADAFEQAAAVSALVKYGSDLAFWAELPDPQGQPDQWAGAYRENLEGLLRVALGRLQGEREQQQLRDFAEACRRLVSLLDCKGQSWAVMDSSRAVAAGVQSLRDLRSQLDMVAAGVAVKTAAAGEAADAEPAAPEPAEAAPAGGGPEPAAAAAAAPAPAQWSNPRSPAAWRRMRGELNLASGETWWQEQRRADPQAFRGNTKTVRITRAKAEEWGLDLPEFGSPH